MDKAVHPVLSPSVSEPKCFEDSGTLCTPVHFKTAQVWSE